MVIKISAKNTLIIQIQEKKYLFPIFFVTTFFECPFTFILTNVDEIE